jgi:hypothetical protein
MTFRLRGPIAIAAVGVVLAADYWIVHRPEPHSIAEFNPIKVKLGKEELILANPALSRSSLLSHQGGKSEVVEIFFDSGVLSATTRGLLRGQPWAQSQQPHNISYTTLDAAGAKGPPCRTSVEIKSSDSALSELRMFQDGIAGGEYHRELSLKTASRIQVDFLTAADDPAQANQSGCHKLLQVGVNQIGLMGMLPLSILGEAGSSVRFKFMPASSTPIWKGSKGLFEPFQGVSLGARIVRLSPIDSQQKLFLATTSKDEHGLVIDTLLVGSDSLEMRLSGVGWVTVNDRPISPTLREWISASSVRASLMGFLNLVVFCGVILFGAGSPQSAGRLIQLAAGRPGFRIPSAAHGLVVFLCHCSEDKMAVRDIDRVLKSDGFQPWLDEDDIFPARVWDKEIKQGLQSSHAVIVCLSKTFARKEGYVQKELRYAIDLAREKPDGAVFLIPVRLEDCEILPSLAELQCIDWYKPDGHEKLLRALRERAKEVGIESDASNATASR